MPCFNKAELTLNCLRSLQANTDAALYEVILVDNGSKRRHRQPGSRRGPPVPGRAQRGEHRLRPRLQPGGGAWPAASTSSSSTTTRSCSRVGWSHSWPPWTRTPRWPRSSPSCSIPTGASTTPAVSSSGAASHGSTARAAPSRMRRNSRAVELRTTPRGHASWSVGRAFDDVGGFDDRFAPAYYEDTDLSFSLRAAGWKVLFEPASKVVHVEGGTAGTDVSQGIKRYQIRNAVRFTQKWSSELAQRPPLRPEEVERWAHRPQGGFGPGETLRVPRRLRRRRRPRRGLRGTLDPRPRPLHAGIRPGIGGASHSHDVALSARGRSRRHLLRTCRG